MVCVTSQCQKWEFPCEGAGMLFVSLTGVKPRIFFAVKVSFVAREDTKEKRKKIPLNKAQYRLISFVEHNEVFSLLYFYVL